MAGVAQHSSYQEDPLGRLRRTAGFVGTTTFGTVAEAEAAVAQVQRVHRRVKGIAPDGRPYSADDPELVTFIHVAEVSSFLASSQRYGPRPLTPEDCDRYYDEVAPVAVDLGARLGARARSPRSRATCCGSSPSSTWARRRGRPGTGCCAAWPGRPSERAVYGLVVAAAVGVLPGWARRKLGLSARRAPRPARRHGGRHAAHARADGGAALAGGATAPEATQAPGLLQVAMESPPSTTTTWPVT